jgi:hypothetical protein
MRRRISSRTGQMTEVANGVIPEVDRSKPFDFDWEATTAAVGEACDRNSEAGKNCNWNELCPECETLKRLIKFRLMRAFLAGKRTAVAEMEVSK